MYYELFCYRCDKLKIIINNLLSKHKFVCKIASFIYRDESSELAKSLFKFKDCFNAFDFKVIIVSARRCSMANDCVLHCGISERRCARR